MELLGRYRSKPRGAFVDITGKCNLACVYCGAPEVNTSESMTFDNWSTVLSELTVAGILDITITGGEPFLHPDVALILEAAVNAFRSVTVLSNGILIGDMLHFLKHFEPKRRLRFQISLDGADECSNGDTRVGSDFELIWENIRSIMGLGFALSVNCTVTKYLTEERLKMLISRLGDEGITRLGLVPLAPAGNARAKWDVLKPSRDTIDRIILLDAQTINGVHISSSICNFDFPSIGQQAESQPSLKRCGAGRDSLAVAVNGDIYPCNFWAQKIGNIFECSLAAIWKESDVLGEIKCLERATVSSIAECSGCDNLMFCGGGCRAYAYSLHGNMWAIDPYCWHRGDYRE